MTSPTAPRAPAPASPPGTGRGRHWGVWDAVGSLLGFVVVSLACSVGLVVAGVDPITASIAGTVLGWVPLAGWPVVATRRRGNGPRADLGLAFRPVDLGIGLLAALVVFAAAAVFTVLYLRLTGTTPSSAVGTAAQSAHASWQVVALAVMAVLAPWMEELHFRGLWWAALRRKGLPGWATLLVTAALFAIAHVEPSRVPLLFAAGLAAGYVRMVTGRLGPGIVAHLVVNLVAALGLLTLIG